MNDTEEVKRNKSEILRAMAVSLTAVLLTSIVRCGCADEIAACVGVGEQAMSSSGRKKTGALFCK